MLRSEFIFFLRKKRQGENDVKLRIAKLIGELIKFGVYPSDTAFRFVNVGTLLLAAPAALGAAFLVMLPCATPAQALVDDFTPASLQTLVALLETCGRFLYLVPETHDRCVASLENLKRQKSSKVTPAPACTWCAFHW